jgi:hypothetical protein
MLQSECMLKTKAFIAIICTCATGWAQSNNGNPAAVDASVHANVDASVHTALVAGHTQQADSVQSSKRSVDSNSSFQTGAFFSSHPASAASAKTSNVRSAMDSGVASPNLSFSPNTRPPVSGAVWPARFLDPMQTPDANSSKTANQYRPPDGPSAKLQGNGSSQSFPPNMPGLSNSSEPETTTFSVPFEGGQRRLGSDNPFSGIGAFPKQMYTTQHEQPRRRRRGSQPDVSGNGPDDLMLLKSSTASK